MQKPPSILVSYYYFDSKGRSKHDLRGLLSSILIQLNEQSSPRYDLLSQVYNTHGHGSDPPSEVALAQCLKDMIKLPGQVPIYIIVDALDECPNNIEMPSPREEVLGFLEDLVGSKHSNLYICLTSRPEQDIKAILDPFSSDSHHVCLHEEDGQIEDIKEFVRYTVHNDKKMRRWAAEDKEYVINTLSNRADGMCVTYITEPHHPHSWFSTGFSGCTANWTLCKGVSRQIFAMP
jgi:hypothetical protein